MRDGVASADHHRAPHRRTRRVGLEARHHGAQRRNDRGHLQRTPAVHLRRRRRGGSDERPRRRRVRRRVVRPVGYRERDRERGVAIRCTPALTEPTTWFLPGGGGCGPLRLALDHPLADRPRLTIPPSTPHRPGRSPAASSGRFRKNKERASMTRSTLITFLTGAVVALEP